MTPTTIPTTEPAPPPAAPPTPPARSRSEARRGRSGRMGTSPPRSPRTRPPPPRSSTPPRRRRAKKPTSRSGPGRSRARDELRAADHAPLDAMRRSYSSRSTVAVIARVTSSIGALASIVTAFGSPATSCAVGGGDAFLDGVGVVALLDAAGGAAARRRDRHRQVEQQRQVGRAHLARQLGDPVALRLLALVRERRQQVAVADDVRSRPPAPARSRGAGGRADRRRTAAPSRARRPGCRRAGGARRAGSRAAGGPTGPVLGSRVA